MYAIVEIAGQQFKVEEGKNIFVHRLEVEEGKKLEFDQVLLIDEDGKITIGEPVIKDAVVEGKVMNHVRGDKVIVFKKKRKKGYRVKNGHRQNFTQVEIVSISGAGIIRKAAPEKVAAHKKEAAHPVISDVTEESPKVKKAAVKKSEATKEKKEAAPAKKAPAKKTAEKKPAEKKPAEKKASKGKAK